MCMSFFASFQFCSSGCVLPSFHPMIFFLSACLNQFSTDSPSSCSSFSMCAQQRLQHFPSLSSSIHAENLVFCSFVYFVSAVRWKRRVAFAVGKRTKNKNDDNQMESQPFKFFLCFFRAENRNSVDCRLTRDYLRHSILLHREYSVVATPTALAKRFSSLFCPKIHIFRVWLSRPRIVSCRCYS